MFRPVRLLFSYPCILLWRGAWGLPIVSVSPGTAAHTNGETNMLEIRAGYMGNDLNVYLDGRRIARTDVFRRQRAFYLVDDSGQNHGPSIVAKSATPRRLSREPRRVLGLLGMCGLNLPGDTQVVFKG